jgi:hypothetical protein
MITTEQAKRMIVDVRKSNPNIVAGFAILPKDQYSSSNELYSEISAYYYKALEELKEKNIVSSTNGGYSLTAPC